MKKMAIRVDKTSKKKLDRDQIIEKYTPFVKIIARRISSRISQSVDVKDLISCGVLGLMDAIEKYDFSRENTFATYAEFRIRGAILDELRSQDWVPRSNRKKGKIVEDVRNKLRMDLGYSPNSVKIAEKLNLTQKQFHDFTDTVSGVSLVSIDDKETITGARSSMTTLLGDCDLFSPDVLLNEKDLSKTISQCINLLPERQKMAVYMYYYEECSLREIGKCLKLTSSRVSQIHLKAISNLKESLKERLGLSS